MVDYNARKASTLPMIDVVDETDKIMVINDGAPPDVVLAPIGALAALAGSYAPAGPVGATGPVGPQGEHGTDLAVKGSVPTTADLAGLTGVVDGDTYVTADTGQLHVYDSGPPATWTVIATSIGPAGPPGPKGATGATGATGPQGIQGPAGVGIAGANVPVGTVLDFVGISAPAGFLMCDGGEYPSPNYPQLSAILLGSQWPQAQTVGYFKVPNLNGKTTVGVDPVDALFGYVGKGGGDKNAYPIDHTHPAGQLAMQSHQHGVNLWSSGIDRPIDHLHTGNTAGAGSHGHGQGQNPVPFLYMAGQGGNIAAAGSGADAHQSNNWSWDGWHGHSFTTDAADRSLDHRHATNGWSDPGGGAVVGTTSPAGVAGTNRNVQPFAVMTKIIRATV